MNIAHLKQGYEALRSDYLICKQKLDSKCEALLILSKDLDQCRQERDQFRLMAEQVQERYQSLKRQLAGVGPRPSAVNNLEFSQMKHQSLAHLLCEMREVNKSLQFEVDDFRQKLKDAEGDIKLLREQIARQRVGTTEEGMTTRHFPAHEREDLVRQLEAVQEQCCQSDRDLQQVLDEKEELVTERDVYKNKYERLNQELNYVLKGDEHRIVDIDALVMENKYLQERVKQMEEEKCIAMATVSKYKGLLERKKYKGIIKLGQGRSGGVVISQKQVQQLLGSKSCLTPTVQMMGDLQSLASALLDTVNDKNLALSHQRKTNKILGNRVAELEKKLKTLEISGFWNIPGKNSSLDKLRLECEEIKAEIETLIPRQASQSSDTSLHSEKDLLEDLDRVNISPLASPTETLPLTERVPATSLSNATLSLEDLDLLPTKEDGQQDLVCGNQSLTGLSTPPLKLTREQNISTADTTCQTSDTTSAIADTYCRTLVSACETPEISNRTVNDKCPIPDSSAFTPDDIADSENDTVTDVDVERKVHFSGITETKDDHHSPSCTSPLLTD